MPPSATVIRAVANHAGQDPVDLPPLYEVVEPEALDKLFESLPNGVARDGGEVAFAYAGYRVTVSFDRTVNVRVEADSG